MITYALFIAGFFLLIKGAEILVDGSASIAKKIGISSIVIGLTVVAFGTSAPEFVINVFASAQGNSEIAIGNILGSNIANILLILGVSAAIYPLAVRKNTALKEIPLGIIAVILLAFLANDQFFGNETFVGLSRMDGLVLLGCFAVFLCYAIGIARSSDSIIEGGEIKKLSYPKAILFIVLGLAGLTIGGKWIVDGAVEIAKWFNVSQSLIGLTIVAIGTSLPELATSAVAARKKQADIAVGNIVGSNIFNIFWVLGASAVIRPLPFNYGANRDVAMTLFAGIILFLALFVGKKKIIERWQGALMVVLYAGYIAFLIWTK